MIVKNILVTICKRIGPNRLLRDTSFHNIGLRYNNERGIYKQETSRFGNIV